MIFDFPPEYRLRSKADFNRLRGGYRLNLGGLCFVYRSNHLTHARLGLAVSRKYGNAVQRNRLKRQLREAFRVHPIRTQAVDVMVYPSKSLHAGMDIQNAAANAFVKVSDSIKTAS